MPATEAVVLNNGEKVSMAQSWGQVFAVVQHLTRLWMTEHGRQVKGWPRPWGGGRAPVDRDLDMAGGAAGVARVGLRVSH